MLFPDFWLKPKKTHSILPFALYPISLLWMILGKIRDLVTSSTACTIPIICVGNITIGGNGKTPTSIKLRDLLKDLGLRPHILSRGYKSRFKGPHFVEPTIDSFEDVGDEALMMALYGPTWISRNRHTGIKSAIKAGANVIILDDGFQNNVVQKDFSILVIESSIGFGNGFLIPAGPLRETVPRGLKKTDLIIMIGEQANQSISKKHAWLMKRVPTIKGSLIPKPSNINLKGKTVIAFAGIAHPEKFKTTLESLGAVILNFQSFANHKPFKIKKLKQLIIEAQKTEAILITTEKDLVRIPNNLQHKFRALKVELKLHHEDILIDKLKNIL